MTMESHHDQQQINLKQQQEDQQQEQDQDQEEEEEEEEYIDMEVSSVTQLLLPITNTNPTSSPQEFEFQTNPSNNNAQPKESPADELFYQGKLLPLFLPSRVLTIQNLHKSLVQSCPVSQELFPDDYLPQTQKPISFDTQDVEIGIRKSWTRKLRTKIKALFGKSLVAGCSVQSSVLVKGTPFGKTEKGNLGSGFCHRRSFSDAFKRRSSMKKIPSLSLSSSSSSSSSSRSSSGVNEGDLIKRSCSANLEMEGSLIQGAIAHCKKSQELLLQLPNEDGIQSLGFDQEV